ncbi:MAG: putative DNA primase/helicase [Chloroflexi bacterium]|jgi:putative DNA primase/helicase|nr:MAG: putative DNA primase/helicase [Chloroflexota bacterium]
MTTLPPPQDPLCVPDPATIAEAIPVVANGPVFGDSRASYGEGSPFEWTIRLSETGAAHRFVAEHKGAILFVAEWKNWYLWTGSHWKEDVEGGVYRLLWRTVELFVTEAADTLKEAEEAFALEASQDNQGRLDMAKVMGKFGHSLQQRRVQTSVLDLASHHSEVVTTFRKLNQGIWLLNTPGTTVDLRDGSTKANDPADLITACTPVPYTPDAPAPRFRQFIDEITADAQAEPRPDLADYLQRLLGLGITGSVREHILPIFHGFFGANGKGTLINCVRTAAGPDYASVAAENLVLRPDDGGDSHPTKIADLYNKRIVVSSELEESAKLAESLIKRLTGADPLKGRRMRQDPWEFEPTHKLFLLTNHRPNVIGTDGGLWRRMRLIPFDRSFHGDNADPQLPEKLQQEAEGILAWLVQGAIFYYATGERPPEVVQAATLKYREEQDDLGHFI